MAEYIQSNNDSGDLAIYAGIGLAGAAGGAALAYRATRDPSNGKTTATGKNKPVAETTKVKTGGRFGFMGKLFGDAPTTGSTLPAESFLVKDPLKKATSTQAPGGIDFNFNVDGTVATVPSGATLNEGQAMPVNASEVPEHVRSQGRQSTGKPVMRGIDPNSVPLTAPAPQPKPPVAATPPVQQPPVVLPEQSNLVNTEDLKNHREPARKPSKRIHNNNIDVTSSPAVSSPVELNLDEVGQSVNAKRVSGQNRSKKKRMRKKVGLRGFI